MGHLALLDALEALEFALDGRPVELHLVGEGDQRAAVESWLNEHGRTGAVRLHGGTDDAALLQLLTQCDVAIVPTLSLEGFGLVVIESMAAGIPVVSTGQGGLIEAMGPWGHSPFVFSLDDPSSLAAGLRAAIHVHESIDGRAQLVSYARQHTWSAAARSIYSLVALDGAKSS
jgi:glycosyltransferase involved in cell wall biosynthesis